MLKKFFWTIITLMLFFSVQLKVFADKPAHVNIVKQGKGYQLLVNGQPFTVKGVGLSYEEGHNFSLLAASGGNSFRTWSTDHGEEELAAAKKYNLMVAMGIDLQKELHHFDYNDKAAVAKQFAWVKQQVNKYKDHPNLLAWVIANEPNLLFDEQGGLAPVNPKVYDALADIIDYIHEVDPHHPVTYTFAGAMKEHIDIALARTPNVDFVSVQVYGGLGGINETLAQLAIDKAFMVTEFGPLGHWEVPKTAWGREIEEPSGVKAASFAERMQQGIGKNSTGLLIGSFAFEWGQKQERTPTWYGVFNKDGAANARVDELTKFWTGKYPKNRAPLAMAITIDKAVATESLYLKPKQIVTVEVEVIDPEQDELTFNWVLLKEVAVRSQGGAFEQEPEQMKITPLNTSSDSEGKLVFQLPERQGDYRIFSYAYDKKGKVANANFPFFIK